MSNTPKNASEKKFQENFCNELAKYCWEKSDELDGNKHKVTEKTLINNWRQELNRLNADQLEGHELTDNEFKQVTTKVEQIQNSYEAAKLLAIEEGTGKIDGIYRDDNPGVTREQITLTIFKKSQVGGSDSSYQIAREVQTLHNNRFDIVLLINGLPLINIEQKRTDKNLDDAFRQFKRYYSDGEYQNNFMAFSQMMVATSEIETRYFATPKTLDDFNTSFVFHWADRENNVINQWQKIIKHFLMIPMAHQMVGDYLVIDKDNRRHMLMRPYQVYALQAIEGAALGKDRLGIPHGGYIWHTTGSGKTITSFKTALILSKRLSYDKVVFMLDRTELDQSTADNFKAYATYETVEVDSTRSTYQLAEKMNNKRSDIVVTTIFKMNSLVKKLIENQDTSLAQKKLVFIIDEAQRTTMGDMMVTIKHYFEKNGLFYGFTGTPLFEENHVKGKIRTVRDKSHLIDTTEKLFGPELHRYTIDEAIRDGNVLGFNVDYINTGEFKNYEDLREHLIQIKVKQNEGTGYRTIEREVQSMDNAKVEAEASDNKLLVYHDKTHIPQVVKTILENWNYQSQNKEFNAILTTARKDRAIAYFDEFQKQLAENNQDLNIAVTFSFGDESSFHDIASPEQVERMFASYEKFTGFKFAFGDKKADNNAYFEDLVDRSTRGGSGLNPKNIDLVIVADQLLTGYDSKKLNTLYVDRSLELQGLIQAYSRTNRVFKKNKKDFGMIVNFQYPALTKERVNNALKLYGSGGKSSLAIVERYDDAVAKFAKLVGNVCEMLKNPADWMGLKDDKENAKKFRNAFLAASKQLSRVQQYYEYKWSDKNFTLSEHQWMRYIGAYKNLKKSKIINTPDEEIEGLINTQSKLVDTQQVTADYVLNLIGNRKRRTQNNQLTQEDLQKIKEELQDLSESGEYQQVKLIERFLDEVILTSQEVALKDINAEFEKWKQQKLVQEIAKFARKWGIDEDLLQKSMQNYHPSESVIPYIEDLNKTISFENAEDQSYGNILNHKLNVERTELPKWMASTIEQYK